MTTELTKAAQQALEALDEIHAGKRHPQLALSVAHNLRRALTQRPAAQAERDAFEEWYAEDANKQTGKPGWFTPKEIAELRDGDWYGEHRVMLNGKWEGWQARASLPTQPAAQSDEQTIVEICERIGFGRVQQIAGHAWEQKHNCAPRGRMGVTVRNETPAPQQATQQAAGEPVAALVRTRSLITRAEIAADGKDHFSEWGPWEPQTLSYAKAVTAPDRNAHPKLYEMAPLFTRPAPGVPEGFTIDQIADACVQAEISDSKFESLGIALAAAQAKGGE